MSESEEMKRFLEKMSKQIRDMEYYLKDIKTIKDDRNSVANLNHARNTVSDLGFKMRKMLSGFRNLFKTEEKEKIDKVYKEALAKINSPDKNMLKNSDNNLNVRKSFMTTVNDQIRLAKQAQQKEIKRAFDERKGRQE